MRIVGLENINSNLIAYGVAKNKKVNEVMGYSTATGEQDMKNGAPWTDRTGNARAGLTGTAVMKENGSEGYLVTEVEYGVHLEMRNYGKYRIIVPIFDRTKAKLIGLLRRSW